MAKYRDDLEAARLRMDTLEAKLAERDAELGERDAALAARDAELAELKAQKDRKGSSFFEPSEEQAKPQQRNGARLLLAVLVIALAAGAIGFIQLRASDRQAATEQLAAEAEHLREKEEKVAAERAAREEDKKAKLRALTDAEQRARIERELAAARFGGKSGDTGRLNVNCMPPSEVFVDGQRIGTTPLRDHPLAPGTHAVVCKHASAGRASKSVAVEADETTTIVLKL